MASASSSASASASSAQESPLVSLRARMHKNNDIAECVRDLEQAYMRLRSRMGANHFCAADGDAAEALAILRELELLADVRRPKGSPMYCVRHLDRVEVGGFFSRVREAMQAGGTGLGVPLPSGMQWPTMKTARDRIRKRMRKNPGAKPRAVGVLACLLCGFFFCGFSFVLV